MSIGVYQNNQEILNPFSPEKENPCPDTHAEATWGRTWVAVHHGEEEAPERLRFKTSKGN
jgi:hypothetical protein